MVAQAVRIDGPMPSRVEPFEVPQELGTLLILGTVGEASNLGTLKETKELIDVIAGEISELLSVGGHPVMEG
jgi:hypothetical protein